MRYMGGEIIMAKNDEWCELCDNRLKVHRVKVKDGEMDICRSCLDMMSDVIEIVKEVECL